MMEEMVILCVKCPHVDGEGQSLDPVSVTDPSRSVIVVLYDVKLRKTTPDLYFISMADDQQ